MELEIFQISNSMCQVSSFMCQVQLSCVKFMFNFNSNQTRFLDERLVDAQTDVLLQEGSSPMGVNLENAKYFRMSTFLEILQGLGFVQVAATELCR